MISDHDLLIRLDQKLEDHTRQDAENFAQLREADARIEAKLDMLLAGKGNTRPVRKQAALSAAGVSGLVLAIAEVAKAFLSSS